MVSGYRISLISWHPPFGYFGYPHALIKALRLQDRLLMLMLVDVPLTLHHHVDLRLDRVLERTRETSTRLEKSLSRGPPRLVISF